MYNAETKQRFIDFIDIEKYPNMYWNRVFKDSEELEDLYGIDLYDFSKKDILTFYKFLDSRSFDTLRVININLSKYSQWALQEGLVNDGQNHFSEISTEEIQSCVSMLSLRRSIVTKDEVMSIVRALANKQDSFIILASFEGLNAHEITEANINDLDFKTLEFTTKSGRKVKFSKDLAIIATEASQAVTYTYSNERISLSTKTLYGAPGDIYKDVRVNVHRDRRILNLRRTYERLRGELGIEPKITLNTIIVSGLIHTINEFAKNDNISTREVVENDTYLRFLENQYGFNYSAKKTFFIKYDEFLGK